MGFNLDFSDNQSMDDLDQPSFVNQPGWYRALVEDTHEDNESGARVMKYKIIKGASTDAFNGSTTTDKINNPELSQTQEKQEMSIRRAKGMAKRLGVIDDSVIGKTVEPNWLSAIGREVVLHLKERSYKNEKGESKTICTIDFLGVYPLTHPEIPDAIRAALSLPPAVRTKGGQQPPPQAGGAKPGVTAPAAVKGNSSGGAGAPARQPAAAAVDVSGL